MTQQGLQSCMPPSTASLVALHHQSVPCTRVAPTFPEVFTPFQRLKQTRVKVRTRQSSSCQRMPPTSDRPRELWSSRTFRLRIRREEKGNGFQAPREMEGRRCPKGTLPRGIWVPIWAWADGGLQRLRWSPCCPPEPWKMHKTARQLNLLPVLDLPRTGPTKVSFILQRHPRS